MRVWQLQGRGVEPWEVERARSARACGDRSVELGLCGDGGRPRGRGALGSHKPTGLTVSFMQAGAATGRLVV